MIELKSLIAKKSIAFISSICLFLLLSSSLCLGQTRSNKIITIHGEDTLVLDLDNFRGNIDSMIEESLKKLYNIDQGSSKSEYEFKFDTIIGGDLNFALDDIWGLMEKLLNPMGDSLIFNFKEFEWNEKHDNESLNPSKPFSFEFDIDNDSKPKKKRSIGLEKKITLKLPDGNWAGFYFGLGHLLNDNGSFASATDGLIFNVNTAQSFDIHLNPFQKRFQLYKQFVGVTTGFGFNWKRFDLNNRSITLTPTDSAISISQTSSSFEKSTLRVSYLQIPILLEFNSKSKEKTNASWHFNFGILGKLKIGNSWISSTANSRTVVRDDFGHSPFLLTGFASAGYRSIQLFSEIGLRNLFQSNTGYSMKNFSCGLMWKF